MTYSNLKKLTKHYEFDFKDLVNCEIKNAKATQSPWHGLPAICKIVIGIRNSNTA